MLRTRHNLAPVLSILLLACASVDADDRTASGGDDAPHDDVPADCGEVGEPCVRDGESCHFTSYDCDDIFHVCVDGAWEAEQRPAGSCPEFAPSTGSPCDPFVAMCLGSCQYEAGPATCMEGSWWAYPEAPATDCTLYADDAACASDPACMWARSCESGEAACIPGVTCDPEGASCSEGLVCTPLQIDAFDVAHGTCGPAAHVAFCLPP